MKKSFMMIFFLIIFGYLNFASDFKFEKKLSVSENTTYGNNIISLSGHIDIKGTVEKSIIMIGGFLNIDGEVKEDVICIASDVKLGKNAWIKGELLVIGGELNRNAMSKVNGEFFYYRFDLKKIESTLIPVISDTRTITFLKILKIIFWLILTLVVFAIVPQKINQTEEMFEKNILKIGVAGFISLFSFLFLLIVFILLCFLIIGIPLLFLLILLYFVVLIFGRTVMFYFIGTKISNSLNVRNISPSIFILIGVVFYTILKFLPYLGPFLLALMNICELGIGVSLFFRKRMKLKV